MRLRLSAMAGVMVFTACGSLSAVERVYREPGTLLVAEDNSSACVAGYAADWAKLSGVLEELRARTKALAEVILGRPSGDDELGGRLIRTPPTLAEVTAALDTRDGLTNGAFQGWTTAQLFAVIGLIARKWPGAEQSLLEYKDEVAALRNDAQRLGARLSRPFRGDLGQRLDEMSARHREAERLHDALLNAADQRGVAVNQVAVNDACNGRMSGLN